MYRIYKHTKFLKYFLQELMMNTLNVSLKASRTGWDEAAQKSITNNALLIRKYQRRLKLIKMVS